MPLTRHQLKCHDFQDKLLLIYNALVCFPSLPGNPEDSDTNVGPTHMTLTVDTCPWDPGVLILGGKDDLRKGGSSDRQHFSVRILCVEPVGVGGGAH